MKLSFVIPAHNEEFYIASCIEATLKTVEERKDMEIIVVDNGSTDRTREVVKRYPQVRLIEEQRLGTNRARQTGLEAARGELVAHIDADSLPTKKWLDYVSREMEKNQQLVCVSGTYVFYDLPKLVNVLNKIYYLIAYFVYLLVRFFFKKASMIQGGNFVVRRSAVLKAGGYNTEIQFYGDDTDIAKRLSAVGRVKFTLRMPIRSSGRRLASEGVAPTVMRYIKNYVWVSLFNRPLTTHYESPRPKQVAGKIKFAPEAKRRDIMFALITIAVLLLLLGSITYLFYRLIN